MNSYDYQIGSRFTVNGTEWAITDIATRPSKTGRAVRVFTVSNGERTRTLTSRGITFWVNGGSDLDAAVEAAADAEVSGGLAAAIAAAVQPYMENAVDEGKVRRIVDERITAAAMPRRVEVVSMDGTTRDVGVQHTHFDALLRIVASRLNAWLVGPAGSGKSTAGKNVADALGLPFYTISIGPQTSKSDLLGYMDANGRLVRTQLREAYENGGVFVLDEVDMSPAGIGVINTIMANSQAGFPDAVVKRHPDFVLIAGANTVGQGADRKYVSRQQIDAATLDRFVFLPWDSDPVLESACSGIPLSAWDGLPRIKPFKFHDAEGAMERCVEFIQKTTRIRMKLQQMGDAVRMVVGNRTNLHGTAMIKAGFTVADALEATVWRGCSADQRAKVDC